MSRPTSQQYHVVEVRGGDDVVTPGAYPRAIVYDDGGLVLFPADDNGHLLRISIAEFAEDDDRAVALGVVGTVVVLQQSNRQKRKSTRKRRR